MAFEPDLSLLNNSQPDWRFGTRLGNAAKGLLGNRDLALALLANSRGPNAGSFGQALGTSMIQADQMKQGREDDAFKRQYMQAQMAAMLGKTGQKPQSIQEYEYAQALTDPAQRAAYQQFANAGGKGEPSEVQAYKYWASLTPQQQQDFLKLKRNVGSDYAIETVNGVPTVIYKPAAGGPGVAGGTPLVTPLTNLNAQAAGAETVKQAEGRGATVGKAQGEITGGIQTKGANAVSVLGMLDEAEKLIPDATGSSVGAAVDATAGVFGNAPKGAKAIAKLKVIQAGLMLNMPRMEGPQSDRDVELYREAAASLGEPNVPRETKQAAIQQIRDLQERYKARAEGSAAPANAPASGKKRKYNPATGRIE